MASFRSPQINLYARDLPRLATFYAGLGFVETFRTPAEGAAEHVELTLNGFRLGIATVAAARAHHGLAPGGEGRWNEVVLWTDDVDGAVAGLAARGLRVLAPAHDFLGGRLRAAWVADPEGNPVQVVERRS
jgi:predicted enzyme related to lactoylglutathione lyase